jgi:hypothetical protein
MEVSMYSHEKSLAGGYAAMTREAVYGARDNGAQFTDGGRYDDAQFRKELETMPDPHLADGRISQAANSIGYIRSIVQNMTGDVARLANRLTGPLAEPAQEVDKQMSPACAMDALELEIKAAFRDLDRLGANLSRLGGL